MGDIIEFPQPKPDEDVRPPLPDRAPPAKVARIDSTERWNQGTRWGDLRAPQLASVLDKAKRGDVADWTDLCEFMLEDDLLGSLHQTRMLRVTQSDWIIKPSEFGNRKLAELAAELVNELFGLIENWAEAQKKLLHAIGAGFACGQMIWEHDRAERRYWVQSIEWVHNHRFAYDEAWQLRINDRGRLSSRASMYGRALDPALWIVHRHQPNAGYPGTAGQLRQCAWVWMFRRWVDKFWLEGVETAGKPVPYAKVPQNTSRAAREALRDKLQQLANGSAGVVDDTVIIESLDAAAATRSWEAYEQYMSATERRLTTNYLGASDLVAPGANGSQAAVSTRTGATADPRMVDDGDALSSTLRATMFKQMVAWNAHLLGAPASQIPLPEMRRKTADDEVKTDRGDKVTEIRDELDAEGNPIPRSNVGLDGKPLPGVMPPQLQAHAQAAADAAKAIAEDPDPKAGARASTRAGGSGATMPRWAETGGRSRTPLEQALSSGLAGSGRSSPKRSK